jgi:hypothetical protein
VKERSSRTPTLSHAPLLDGAQGLEGRQTFRSGAVVQLPLRF